MMKKFVCLMLSVALGVGAAGMLVGCKPSGSRNRPEVDLDPTKQTIMVSCFTAGYGSEWLVNYLNDYNTRHKESGKYQFALVPDNMDDVPTIGQQLQAGAGKAEIYFNDTSDVYSLVRSGRLMDLKDIWDMPVENAPGDTVRENIFDYELYEEVYSHNGGIYALPFTQGVSGLFYDHDLLRDYDYLAKDPGTDNGLTKGRDGKEGTYDDGLPVTVDEFFALCDAIKNDSKYPIVVCERVDNDGMAADGLAYQYEGKDNFYATMQYDGTYTKKDGSTVEITPDKGYLAWTECNEGKKFAMDVLGRLELGDSYRDPRTGLDHRGSENQFVFSHRSTPVAMIFNGFWWVYEARTDFEADVKRGGESVEERDLRFMPLPIDPENTPEELRDKNVLVTNNDGSVFAVETSDPERKTAIKDFLRDYATGGACDFFTESTYVTLAYKYEVSDEVIENLPPYGKNVYEVMNAPNTVVVRRKLISFLQPLNNLATGTNEPLRWGGVVNGTTYRTLRKGQDAAGNVETFFNANKTLYTPQRWLEIYNSTIGG